MTPHQVLASWSGWGSTKEGGEVADDIIATLAAHGYRIVPDGVEMETWKDPGGGDVAGTDYHLVTGPEWFDDLDDPTPLRRQQWVCIEDETGTWWPSCVVLCDACTGEGELCPPDTEGVVECPVCKGTGEHPMRGAGFVTEERSDA